MIMLKICMVFSQLFYSEYIMETFNSELRMVINPP